MRPAFFADKLKDMVGHMSRSATQMTRDWEMQVSAAGGGSVEMEVAKPIKDTTADILSRTLLGSSYLQGKAVFEMQVELLEILVHRRILFATIPGYGFLPTRDNRRAAALAKKINVELGELVMSHEEGARGGGGWAEKEDADMLGMIVAA